MPPEAPAANRGRDRPGRRLPNADVSSVRPVAGRTAERVLPEPQSVAERCERRTRSGGDDRRRVRDAHQIRHGSWVYGEELEQRPPCGGRPTAREDRVLPLRRKQGSRTSSLQLDQTACRTRSTPKRTRKPACRIRLSTCSCTTRVTRSPRRSMSATASRSTTPSSVTTSTTCAWSPDGRELLFYRTNRRQNMMEVVAAIRPPARPGDHARGMADRLGHEHAHGCVFAAGRQAIHLGVGAERLATISISTI